MFAKPLADFVSGWNIATIEQKSKERMRIFSIILFLNDKIVFSNNIWKTVYFVFQRIYLIYFHLFVIISLFASRPRKHVMFFLSSILSRVNVGNVLCRSQHQNLVILSARSLTYCFTITSLTMSLKCTIQTYRFYF